MGSILQTTLNTRVLPIGNFRYVRSDYPGKLTDDEVRWLYQKGFVYHHLPVTGGGDTPKSPEAVAETYLGMIDEQMDKR